MKVEKSKLSKKVLMINILYTLLVSANLGLSLYSMISYHLWLRGLWEGRQALFGVPHLFTIRTVLALSALTIPMIVVCICFHKYNKIALKRHKVLKGLAIWLPLAINLINLLALFELVLMGLLEDF